MERFLRGKEDAGQSARMSAGICWKWEDRSGTEPEVTPEPGWARPWNAGDQHETPGVPKRRYWATESGGFGQIGCVHTAQGLEYEWGGVIMGPDLTWDGDGWKVHREHVLSKASRIRSDDELARAICNTYGVLMTRSIRGTVLYSVDPATRKHRKSAATGRVPAAGKAPAKVPSTERRLVDEIDERIITLLTGDARLSARAIAREVGMSPGAISERIDRLEASGIITGHAVVDIAALGFPLRAIVSVRVSRGRTRSTG